MKNVHIKNGYELLEVISKDYNNEDMVIMTGAVSDYEPYEVSEKSIKKDNNGLNIKI